MFKRIRWMSIGAVLGVWAYVWTRERARVDSSQGGMPVRPGTSKPYEIGLQLGQRLRTVLKEGRAAMQERERELRTTPGSNGHNE